VHGACGHLWAVTDSVTALRPAGACCAGTHARSSDHPSDAYLACSSKGTRQLITCGSHAAVAPGNHWQTDTFAPADSSPTIVTLRPAAISAQTRTAGTTPGPAPSVPALLRLLSPPRPPYLNSAVPLLLCRTPSHHADIEADFWHVPGTPLATILQHSDCGVAADADRRVLLLQLCLALAHWHARGTAHGDVSPANVSIAYGALVTLRESPAGSARSAVASGQPAAGAPGAADTPQPRADARAEPQPSVAASSRSRAASPAAPPPPRCLEPSLQRLTALWRSRGISTFEYLLHVNSFAGRRFSDLDRLPLFPWVLDFTADPRPGLRHTCANLFMITLLSLV
jgi:Beige/BEACH domain